MKKNMVPGIIGNNADQMLWSGSTLLSNIPFWMLGVNKLEFWKSVLSQLSMILFGTTETFFLSQFTIFNLITTIREHLKKRSVKDLFDDVYAIFFWFSL